MELNIRNIHFNRLLNYTETASSIDEFTYFCQFLASIESPKIVNMLRKKSFEVVILLSIWCILFCLMKRTDEM